MKKIYTILPFILLFCNCGHVWCKISEICGLPTIITANFNITFIIIRQINFCVTHFVTLYNLFLFTILQLSKYRNSRTCNTIHLKIQRRVKILVLIIVKFDVSFKKYMCSILTKQSSCRQLLVCVLLSYLIEHINTNI